MKLTILAASIALALTPAVALAQQSDAPSDEMPAKPTMHKKKSHSGKSMQPKAMSKNCDPMAKTTDTRKLQKCS